MASMDLPGQILELLEKSPDAIATIQQVLNAFSSVNITTPDPGELFLTNEDQYLALMMGALELLEIQPSRYPKRSKSSPRKINFFLSFSPQKKSTKQIEEQIFVSTNGN